MGGVLGIKEIDWMTSCLCMNGCWIYSSDIRCIDSRRLGSCVDMQIEAWRNDEWWMIQQVLFVPPTCRNYQVWLHWAKRHLRQVAVCPVLATPIKKMTRGGLAVSQPKYVFLHQLFLFSGKEVNKCSDDQSISVPSDYPHLWWLQPKPRHLGPLRWTWQFSKKRSV